jgi:hypothetical protein
MNMGTLTALLTTLLWVLPVGAEPIAAEAQQGAEETATVPSELFVPVGTVITVRTRDPLSSNRNEIGDEFLAALSQPLVVDGWVVVRAGQTVIGRVVRALESGRTRGTSELGIELSELLLVDGQQSPIRTQFIRSDGPTSVDRDVGAVAAGTGLGAIIGGAASGGKGAAIGAVAGAAASVIAVLSTRGRATEVAAETELTFRLDAPLTISTGRSAHAFLPVTGDDYNAAPTLQLPTSQRRDIDRQRNRRPSYRSSVFFGFPAFYSSWPRNYGGRGYWGHGISRGRNRGFRRH